MNSEKIFHVCCIALAQFFLTAPGAYAQEDNARQADILYKGYRFSDAIDKYADAMVKTRDSAELARIDRQIAMCETAEDLLDYAMSPKVIAVKNIPLPELPAYLASIQGRWTQIPNPLVSASTNPYVTATCFPDDLSTIIFSAPDTSGKWHIYQTTRENDTLWSEPEFLSPLLTSKGNEIFPFISPGGMELYFASDGMNGMGGYDLFVSTWNETEKEWGEPVNIGFPFSSIDDDILYFNTYDGNWTVNVSTRGCAPGNVKIFLSEYEVSPDQTSISDIAEILSAAEMKVIAAEPQKNIAASFSDPNLARYATLFQKMSRSQSKCNELRSQLEVLRDEFENARGEKEKADLSGRIQALEKESLAAENEKSKAEAMVREAENDFLKRGIIPPVIDVEEEPAKKNDVQFEFKKSSLAAAPNIVLEQSEPDFDYTFRKESESVIADRDMMPDGLVYQIQLTVLSTKASPSRFKGFSPVFEFPFQSGKYQYSVGAFRTYAQAAAALPKVQKGGFPNAYLIAFWNKKSLAVKDARIKERSLGKAMANTSFNVIIGGLKDGLTSDIKSAITSNCSKDLAKSSVNGETVYIIGPFGTRDEADNLAAILKKSGAPTVDVEPVK